MYYVFIILLFLYFQITFINSALYYYENDDIAFYYETTCPVDCRLTLNIQEANIVIDNKNGLYKHLFNDKFKALVTLENKKYYPWINEYKKYNYKVQATVYNDAEIKLHYLPFHSHLWINKTSFIPLTDIKRKTKGIAMISNCDNNNNRLPKIRELQSLGIEIDTFGGCFGNAIRNTNKNTWEIERLNTFSEYMFGISFENYQDKDYVTEKLFLTLASGAIPIYSGASNVNEYLPNQEDKIIIDISKYKNLNAVAVHIKEIINNKELYLKYQEWRSKPISEEYLKQIESYKYSPQCRICIEYYNSKNQDNLSDYKSKNQDNLSDYKSCN